MTTYRYSEWDGTQPALRLDKDELMDELAQGLMHDSDLSFILWKMQREDRKNGQERLTGLQKLLQRLLEEKQKQLGKYDLDTMMAEMKKKMDDIVKQEQASILKKLDEARKKAAQSEAEPGSETDKNQLQKIEQKAAADLKKLKNLPSDISGKVKALQNYEFTDEEAQQQFRDLLGASLEGLNSDEIPEGATPYLGEESISFNEAMKLIETLQEMDKLNGQIENARADGGPGMVNRQSVRELLGEQGMETLERPGITKVLEEANFIRRKEGGFELTPMGVRKIGQKAVNDVFSQLRYKTGDRGGVWKRGDETKRFEFGDNFDIDLKQTIMNALMREQQHSPVKLKITDFEVYKYEQSARSATVLMLDLSLSMSVRDNFYAAKHVALALDGLIRSQFPQDSLHIIGFSSYAREIKKEELATLRLDQADPYTNIQHGLELARKLLGKENSRNKQIIIITDGEPTAHLEEGQLNYQFSPGAKTLQMTLREVENCTRQGITINTFMLGESNLNNAFITRIAKINKGRVFFANPAGLGQYVLVDYLSNRRKSVS
jgi:Uncharacterized protein with a von Willebrand factor type A (vWA) domain